MKESPAELWRRIETLEDRISKLSVAFLRISASLDVEAVLREIVDSARELTGARFGLITTVDDAGQPQDFVQAGAGNVAARASAVAGPGNEPSF